MRALAHVIRMRPWNAPSAFRRGPDVGHLLERGAMPEHESALALARYGIPFAEHRRAINPYEAEAAAYEIGPPVVVKIDGPSHKSAEGGVVRDVTTPEAAADAARRLTGPVLVAKQVAAGVEALCGMTRDPDFGPVLAVGRGGSAVEQLDSVVVTLAPLEIEDARELVAEAGVEDPGDTIARALVAVGDLALSHPEIQAIDVNPLVVGPEGTFAVDALVVVS
jgi:acetyltransferase